MSRLTRAWVLGLACFVGGATVLALPSAGFAEGLGVTANSDGWITYTDTIASTLTFVSQAVTTLTGTIGSDGTCTISDSSAPVPATNANTTFSEETAYNPVTCQEQELSGELTPASAELAALLYPQSLNNPATPEADGSTSASPGPTNATVAGQAAASSTQYQSAYTRSAWVDPFHIVITSLAVNLKWPLYGAGGTLSGRNNPYEFALDGWTNSGTPPVNITSLSDNSGWSSTGDETFKNTDFEKFVFATFGVAGLAICGFDTGTAVFKHSDNVIGYRDDARGGGDSDSVKGGCSDLVHHANWGGFGWTTYVVWTTR